MTPQKYDKDDEDNHNRSEYIDDKDNGDCDDKHDEGNDDIAKDLILVPSVSLLCCFPRSGEGDSCEMFHMLLSNLDKVE